MSPETSPPAPDLATLLKRDSSIFVVLHKDPLRERIDVRASRVLAWEEDVLFLHPESALFPVRSEA